MTNWTEEDLAAHASQRGMQKVQKATGRSPQPKGMNRTETAYAQHLALQKQLGEILWYGFEAMKVRIGANCWLSPDFLVMYADGHLELHDTKGRKKHTYYAEDDAIVKARAVGAHFPIPMFFLFCQHDGEWKKAAM